MTSNEFHYMKLLVFLKNILPYDVHDVLKANSHILSLDAAKYCLKEIRRHHHNQKFLAAQLQQEFAQFFHLPHLWSLKAYYVIPTTSVPIPYSFSVIIESF